MAFHPSRAKLQGPQVFPRYEFPDAGEPLAAAGLRPSRKLVVAERHGVRRAFPLSEISYHHVAQGRLGGEPFAAAYCVVCHTGAGVTPVVEGELLHLSVGGVSDGVGILIDDETHTYWDLMTGAALHGPLLGHRLPVWPLRVTTVAAALAEHPDLTVSRSRPFPLRVRHLMVQPWVARTTKPMVLPFGFRSTMEPVDGRRPEMEAGLGVIVGERARFYPLAALAGGRTERWEGRTLRLSLDGAGFPRAEWEDGGRPFHLLTRWYGFAAAFPKCEVAAGEVGVEEVEEAFEAMPVESV